MAAMRPVATVLLLPAAVLLLGCHPEPVMGVLTPASGEAEAYGATVHNGIRLALDEARLQGVLPADFELIEADTASNPTVAAAELRRLAEQHHVRLVVGGVTSTEAEALIPVVEDERVVCLSPSATATDLGRRSRYFYRLFASDEVEGAASARFLYDEAGIRRLMVYTDNSSFTRGLEAEFRQHFEMVLGGEIARTIHLDDDSWAVRSADALHAHHPEAVYVVGHAESILRVLRHLDTTGFRPLRCTTSTFYLADVLGRSGEVADGVMFPLSAYDADSIREPVSGFVERFASRFGSEPDIYAAHGYDAMRLAIQSLCVNNRLRTAELRRYIRFELGQFPGVTGPIAFNDHGDVTRYPIMHCVWKGRVLRCSKLREMRLKKIEEILKGGAEPSRAVSLVPPVRHRV